MLMGGLVLHGRKGGWAWKGGLLACSLGYGLPGGMLAEQTRLDRGNWSTSSARVNILEVRTLWCRGCGAAKTDTSCGIVLLG